MKKIWVLSIKTSLPNECLTRANLKTTFSAFETFEDAKKAMRDAIKSFAFSENTMFNGNGKIIALEKYIAEMGDYKYEETLLTRDILSKIKDSLFEIINGEDTS